MGRYDDAKKMQRLREGVHDAFARGVIGWENLPLADQEAVVTIQIGIERDLVEGTSTLEPRGLIGEGA